MKKNGNIEYKMTNEEAISYLKWARPINPYSLDKKKVQMAIDMAIEALLQTEEDLISRQTVEDAIAETIVNGESLGYAVAYDILSDIPSAKANGDLVSKSVLDQIRWERDVAIEQLKDLGYGLGEKPRTDGDLISQFRDYQIEWLTSHNDIDLKEAEMWVVQFLKDTADCFLKTEVPSAKKTDTNHYRVVDTSYSPYTIDSTTKSHSITIPKVAEKTAEWTKDDECSDCGKYIYVGDRDNYCPYCGARMKGEQTE